MTIRLKKKIDSETLHLPELRQIIGKTVDITVEEESAEKHVAQESEPARPPTLADLKRRQGTKPAASLEELMGTFSEEDFEGFDEWLAENRRRPWRAEPLDRD
jgi:hypothetical protein